MDDVQCSQSPLGLTTYRISYPLTYILTYSTTKDIYDDAADKDDVKKLTQGTTS